MTGQQKYFASLSRSFAHISWTKSHLTTPYPFSLFKLSSGYFPTPLLDDLVLTINWDDYALDFFHQSDFEKSKKNIYIFASFFDTLSDVLFTRII